LANEASAASNKIPPQNRAGRPWHEKEKNVMQFLENGTYVAVVVDGKIHTYGTLRRKALS